MELSARDLGIEAVVRKFNQNHDANGRFASGSGGKMLAPATMAARLREPDGGFTFDPKTGAEPTSGFVVSVYPERGTTLGDVSNISPETILSAAVNFRETNADILAKPGNNIGAWHDPDTHIGHMDISAVVRSASEAAALGRTHKQIAYFDLGSMQSVTL